MKETVYEEENPSDISAGLEKSDVAEIKAYIDQNLASQISLESIADRFHFNKNYVARNFKEIYGMSVDSYIQIVRISKVKELLRLSTRTIEAIAPSVAMMTKTTFQEYSKKSRVARRVNSGDAGRAEVKITKSNSFPKEIPRRFSFGFLLIGRNKPCRTHNSVLYFIQNTSN